MRAKSAFLLEVVDLNVVACVDGLSLRVSYL